MLDAPQGDEAIDQGLYPGGGSANHDDLQAVIVIQVDVGCAEDQVVVFMLQIGQMILQFMLLMRIGQGDHANHIALRTTPLFVHQVFADQVAHGFRTVLVAMPGDELVESGQQIQFQSGGKTGDHCNTIVPFVLIYDPNATMSNKKTLKRYYRE